MAEALQDGSAGRNPFPTTRWTLIFDLKEGQPSARDHALDELCTHYWLPIYAFIRCRGKSKEEAEDLTQGFFAKVIEGGLLAKADAGRGKLRTFLLGCLDNFMCSEWKKETTQKRGGNARRLSIDTNEGERLLITGQNAHELSPEKAFDRAWAVTLINTVHERLAEEYAARGKARNFAVMSGFLAWNERQRTYADAAEALEISEEALRQSVRRLRQRFGTLLRRQLVYTTETDAEIDEELQSLFTAFR